MSTAAAEMPPKSIAVTPKGFFTGTLRFALWTITETLRGFTYALRLVRETTEISHPDAPLIINTSSSVSEPGATYPAAVREPAYA